MDECFVARVERAFAAGVSMRQKRV